MFLFSMRAHCAISYSFVILTMYNAINKHNIKYTELCLHKMSVNTSLRLAYTYARLSGEDNGESGDSDLTIHSLAATGGAHFNGDP